MDETEVDVMVVAYCLVAQMNDNAGMIRNEIFDYEVEGERFYMHGNGLAEMHILNYKN